jgi:hypothetical protein
LLALAERKPFWSVDVNPVKKGNSGDMRVSRKRIIIAIAAVLFFFLAPVVPVTVSPFLLLPLRNQCAGPVVNPMGPITVFVSLSYMAFGLAIAGTVHEGAFGLIYVPNNGWETVQFPPLGFENIVCYRPSG